MSDVICPWCFIGTRRLAQVLASQANDQQVTVRYHPYLLDPTVPREGADLRDRLRRKYGTDPEQMFRRIEAAARETGVHLDFARVTRTPNTILAHTLIRHAGRKGTQTALADALFNAYFVEGQDIGAPDVLVSLAGPHGFTRDEVMRLVNDENEAAATRAEADAAAQAGVRGVPFFVFNNKVAISGAQPAHVFRDALAKASDRGRT